MLVDRKILYEKFEKLKRIIKGYESVFVVFLGGVDFIFLLKVLFDVLGEKVIGVFLSLVLSL